MTRSLITANRSGIACRIIRAARRLGIRTVVTNSDGDSKAPHVGEADKAARLTGALTILIAGIYDPAWLLEIEVIAAR